MQVPALFLNDKKRNLILWLTDMTLAIGSYFYITNPMYIQSVLEKIDLAAIRPDIDPQFFLSPVFQEYIIKTISVVAFLTVGIIALFHTLTFYQCYKRKKVAIAYVKIYSFLAAFSLGMWFIYNLSLLNSLILIPAAVYAFVFTIERQSKKSVSILPHFFGPTFANTYAGNSKKQGE